MQHNREQRGNCCKLLGGGEGLCWQIVIVIGLLLQIVVGHGCQRSLFGCLTLYLHQEHRCSRNF